MASCVTYLSKGSVYERSRNNSSMTHCIVITSRALHKREFPQAILEDPSTS